MRLGNPFHEMHPGGVLARWRGIPGRIVALHVEAAILRLLPRTRTGHGPEEIDLPPKLADVRMRPVCVRPEGSVGPGWAKLTVLWC